MADNLTIANGLDALAEASDDEVVTHDIEALAEAIRDTTTDDSFLFMESLFDDTPDDYVRANGARSLCDDYPDIIHVRGGLLAPAGSPGAEAIQRRYMWHFVSEDADESDDFQQNAFDSVEEAHGVYVGHASE